MSDRTLSEQSDDAEHLRAIWARANEELWMRMQGTAELAETDTVERQALAEHPPGEFEKP